MRDFKVGDRVTCTPYGRSEMVCVVANLNYYGDLYVVPESKLIHYNDGFICHRACAKLINNWDKITV